MITEICEQCDSELRITHPPHDGLCECDAKYNRAELKKQGYCDQCIGQHNPNNWKWYKGFCECGKHFLPEMYKK